MTAWKDTYAALQLEVDTAKEVAKDAFLRSIGLPAVVPANKLIPLIDAITEAQWKALLRHVGPVSGDGSVSIGTLADADGVLQLDLRASAAWEAIAIDPSAVGYAKPVKTIVWQVSGTTPVALWAKVGTANTAWTKIWPSTGATDQLGFKLASVTYFRTEPMQYLYHTPSPYNYTIGGRVWTVQNPMDMFLGNGPWPWITGESAPGAENGGMFWPDNTTTTHPIVQCPLATLGVPALSTLAELWIFIEVDPPPGNYAQYCKLIMVVSAPPSYQGQADFTYHVYKTAYDQATHRSITSGEMLAGATSIGATPTTDVNTDTVMALRLLPQGAEVYSGVPYSVGGNASFRGATFKDLRAQMRLIGSLLPTTAQRNSSAAAAWTQGNDPVLYLTSLAGRYGMDPPPLTGPMWRAIRLDYLEAGILGSGSSGGGGGGSGDQTFYDVTISGGIILNVGTHRNLRVSGTGPLTGIDPAGLTGGEIIHITAATSFTITGGTVSSGAPIHTTKRGGADWDDIELEADDTIDVQYRNDGGFFKVR